MGEPFSPGTRAFHRSPKGRTTAQTRKAYQEELVNRTTRPPYTSSLAVVPIAIRLECSRTAAQSTNVVLAGLPAFDCTVLCSGRASVASLCKCSSTKKPAVRSRPLLRKPNGRALAIAL